MEDFNWLYDQKMIDAFQKSKKGYLLMIDQMVNDLQFGVITFDLRIHNGYVTDLVVVSNKRIRFDLDKEKKAWYI